MTHSPGAPDQFYYLFFLSSLADPLVRGPEPWQRGRRSSKAATIAGATAARNPRARGVEKPVGCPAGAPGTRVLGPTWGLRGLPPRRSTKTALVRALAVLWEVLLDCWPLARLALLLTCWIPGCLFAHILCAGLPGVSRRLLGCWLRGCLAPGCCFWLTGRLGAWTSGCQDVRASAPGFASAPRALRRPACCAACAHCASPPPFPPWPVGILLLLLAPWGGA